MEEAGEQIGALHLVESQKFGFSGTKSECKINDCEQPTSRAKQLLLILAFVLVGTAFTVANKLQTIPMKNYPHFVTVEGVISFIPIGLLYMCGRGYARRWRGEDLTYPWRDLALAAFLTSIGNWLFLFGTQYLDGPLQVLLMQAAVPFSMLCSHFFLRVTYQVSHYLGAALVLLGIFVAVGYEFHTHIGAFEAGWIVGYTMSWLPFTIFFVYTESLYRKRKVDSIVYNLIISIMQVPLLLLFAPCFTYVSRPVSRPTQLPRALLDGCRCFVGIDSRPDDQCWPWAPISVIITNVLNAAWILPTFEIIGQGGSNWVWISNTLCVPLANLAFSLPFVPGAEPLKPNNGIALAIICLGLVVYGYSHHHSNVLSQCTSRLCIRFGREEYERSTPPYKFRRQWSKTETELPTPDDSRHESSCRDERLEAWNNRSEVELSCT